MTLAPAGLRSCASTAALADEPRSTPRPGDSPSSRPVRPCAAVVARRDPQDRIDDGVASVSRLFCHRERWPRRTGGAGRAFAGVGAEDSALAAASVSGRCASTSCALSPGRHLRDASKSGSSPRPAIVVAARRAAQPLYAFDEGRRRRGVRATAPTASRGPSSHAARQCRAVVVSRTSIGDPIDRALGELLPLLATPGPTHLRRGRYRAASTPFELAGVTGLQARYAYRAHGRPAAKEQPNAWSTSSAHAASYWQKGASPPSGDAQTFGRAVPRGSRLVGVPRRGGPRAVGVDVGPAHRPRRGRRLLRGRPPGPAS